MRYPYRCYEHGDFIVEAPITKGPPSIVYCPSCHEESLRIYENPPTHYNSQGFHNTDYNKHGNKLDQLNQSMGQGREKPPPPAKEVPRSGKDPF